MNDDAKSRRKMGPLPISKRLRDAILRLSPTANELDADALFAAEVGAGFRFADDMLSVYAAKLQALPALRLASLPRYASLLKEKKAPGDFIGIFSTHDGIVCIEKRTAKPTHTDLLLFEDARQKPRPLPPLAEWLESLDSANTQPSKTEFLPELVRKPSAGMEGQIVHHPTFGKGRVFVNKGDSPTRILKVAFDKGGLKMIQARFLSFTD